MTPVTPRPKWAENERIGGFRVKRTAILPALSSVFYELFHEATGARHIHIENDNPENTFAVAFRTVPKDSTGVAHILEHTALCGSQKYPVRDPFFSMIRRSLQSFMNAFTAPDWTMYPFCTANTKDYYNLLSVYCDAAFFPALTELSFKQEGWRIEPGESGKPVYKGVVLNEMKGAMSSPDQIIGRSIMAELFPDTTYGKNSGGEPADIPSLTYQGLLDFHRLHYHPSNAWFYTFGNLPLERHLSFLEEAVLSKFGPGGADTTVKNQPRFSAPKTARVPYPLADGAGSEKKAQFALSWLAAPIREAGEVLGLTILEKILLGHPASPLRKALMESGLGSALCDATGYDPELCDTLFSCGLKEMDEADAPKVEDLIFSALSELAEKGVPVELAETAIHQYEFARRELSNSPFSWGLKLFTGFCAPWLHGADPLALLNFDEDLEKVRKGAADGDFFPGMIRRWFLDNPHRVAFTLYPDTRLLQKLEDEEEERVSRAVAAFTDADRKKMEEDAKALAALQEAEEDISCLPTVTIKDVDPKVLVTTADQARSRQGLSVYPAATNGVFYFTLAAQLKNVPAELLHLVPFFCYAFTRCGTENLHYSELSGRIAALTGGLGLSVSSHVRQDQAATPLELAVMDMKCLGRNRQKALELVDELVLRANFADHARLRVLAAEYAAHLQSGVVSAGHRYAMSLCARGTGRSRAVSETWFGVHQVKRMRELAKDLSETAVAGLSRNLSEIGRGIFFADALSAGVVGDEPLLAGADEFFQGLLAGLPARADGDGSRDAAGNFPAFPPVTREGWHTGTSVNFSAHCLKTVRMEHPDAPVLSVAAHLLKGRFLHTEIREKGGAYGSFAVANSEDALFFLASYRDPHVARTLGVFRRAYDYLIKGDYSDQEVSEAVLQVAAETDRPQTGAEAARRAFYRGFMGISDELRQKYKDGVLAVDRKKILEVSGRYFSSPSELSPVAVVGSKASLEAANKEMPDSPLELFPID